MVTTPVLALWAALLLPTFPQGSEPEPVPSATAAPAAPAARPVLYGFEVINTFPHDPAAFTQGLVIRNGVLLESTGKNPVSIRRVRLEDGQVLQMQRLASQYFGEGLTELNGTIYTLTWQHGTGFLWDADDLSPKGQFTYDGEGWGLTHDGQRLILSDGTERLRFFDPQTHQETGSVRVTLNSQPVNRLNELEWIDGEVWANVWQSPFIVRIAPDSGQITGIIDLTGLLPEGRVKDPYDDVLNGIAWDEENRRLFVTGKNWPFLYEIRLSAPR